MRGDKADKDINNAVREGSPPHARGQVADQMIHPHHHRITPACAGTSYLKGWGSKRTQDHPRMRGDKLLQNNTRNKCQGSPPHARGQGFPYIKKLPPFGITPACAGTRYSTCRTKLSSQDHPRMRGDKTPRERCTTSKRGSPPHARGQESPQIQKIVQCGITPACAGTRKHSHRRQDSS